MSIPSEEFTQLSQRIDGLEKVLETQERLFATLLAGYTEVVALVEVLAGRVIGSDSEDEQTEFLKTFNGLRIEMLKHIQGAAGGTTDLDSPDPDLVTAVEQLVAQRKARRPEPE